MGLDRPVLDPELFVFGDRISVVAWLHVRTWEHPEGLAGEGRLLRRRIAVKEGMQFRPCHFCRLRVDVHYLIPSPSMIFASFSESLGPLFGSGIPNSFANARRCSSTCGATSGSCA